MMMSPHSHSLRDDDKSTTGEHCDEMPKVASCGQCAARRARWSQLDRNADILGYETHILRIYQDILNPRIS